MNRVLRRSSALVSVLALLSVAACGKAEQQPMTTAAPPPAPALSAADQSFVQAASASDAFEVQSSQLAATKAHRPAVKDFATQMIQAHTATTQQLTQIVQGKGITPPAPQLTADQQSMLTALGNESGARFDRDYVHDQIVGHSQAVAAFQAEIQNGQDADVKAFAQSTLPTIQQHEQEAQKLAGTHGERAMRHRRARHTATDNAVSAPSGSSMGGSSSGGSSSGGSMSDAPTGSDTGNQ